MREITSYRDPEYDDLRQRVAAEPARCWWRDEEPPLLHERLAADASRNHAAIAAFWTPRVMNASETRLRVISRRRCASGRVSFQGGMTR